VHQDREKDIQAKINWVYGFRCNDVIKPIEYLPPLFILLLHYLI